MPFSNAWDETFPADTQLAKLGAQDMRTIQLNVRERISAFASGLAAARPTPEAVFAGVMYLATDTNKLYQWTGAVWNDITSVIAGMVTGSTPDGASVIRATNVSLNDNTETLISWDSALYDNGGLFNVGTPTRLTIKHDGVYLITANIAFLASATGGRAVKIRKNGLVSNMGFSGCGSAGATQFTGVTHSVLRRLVATDILEVIAWQQSGGPLSIDADLSSFSVQKVRD